MTELVERVPAGGRVLDLGARSGSFETERKDLTIVRADLEAAASSAAGFYVVADAARLPFAAGAFDLIVSNHSLEHFVELAATVREIGRVLRHDGALFVAVPDATTLTDRIYRWLGKGGGHVNAFRSPDEVVAIVERLAGVAHRGTRTLYSGLSFLNAHNFTSRPPRKIALFGFGNERFLAVFVWLLRWADRRWKTRLSHYGWSFYFGSAEAPRTAEDWMNVCVRCGAGHSQAYLEAQRALNEGAWYRCPACGGANLLTRE